MSEYREIVEPIRLRSLSRALSKQLKPEFKIREVRKIGYPAGMFEATVYFRTTDDGKDFWWSRFTNKDAGVEQNFFGRGRLGSKEMLNIDLQFNFKVREFSRAHGGAFLEDYRTGDIIVAHRGIVTRGHGRIKKSKVLSAMAPYVYEADTSNGMADFLLIGQLNSPTLVYDILRFSSELRESVKGETRKENVSDGSLNQRADPDIVAKLREYFDEFEGERTIGARAATEAVCHHGSVVRSLKEALTGSGDVLKSVAIDLVHIDKQVATIYEVKTSAASQSLYTAVGQIEMHTPSVKKFAKGMAVKKVIVLPSLPTPKTCHLIRDYLGIEIVTYKRKSNGRFVIGL